MKKSYKSFFRNQRPMVQINVVPYIDVMLGLRVIFLITTPILSQVVKVDLPKAQSV
ncbi:biopolymer transporter ExbD, partial [Francisella tularensis]|uniref:biopolymer transporter ExbD n=1 Tax=Francisella tularensis TaxID=263 RepID=UPI002381B6C1